MPVAYFFGVAGSMTPITAWLLYADLQVDPIRRSLTPTAQSGFFEDMPLWKSTILADDLDQQALSRDTVILPLQKHPQPKSWGCAEKTRTGRAYARR